MNANARAQTPLAAERLTGTEAAPAGRRRERPLLPRVAFMIAALAVVAGGVVVLFANLSVGTLGVDEPLYVRVGWDYLHGDASENLEHPYLAKQVIGASQLVFGRTLLGARIAGSLLGALTAVVVFDIGRRLAGRWTGLLAAALFLLPPQAPGTNVIRVDRVAVLESTMGFLVALSLLLAVIAVQRRSGPFLVAAGTAAGLAVSAKIPGAVAIAPVMLAGLAVQGGLRRIMWLAGAAAAALFAFWLPYTAPGDARLAGLRYALEFQAQHAADGHPQIVAGALYLHAPWWSHWWWQQDYLGPVPTTALWTAAVVPVVWLLRRRAPAAVAAYSPVLLLLAASVVFLLVSPLRLPHYHLLWSVPLSVVAASGLSLAATRNRLLAGLLLAPLAVMAAQNITRAATLQPSDYSRLPRALAEAGVASGPVLLVGYPQVAQHYLPASTQLTSRPERAKAIVIDPVVADRLPDTEATRALYRAVTACTLARRVDRLLVHTCSSRSGR